MTALTTAPPRLDFGWVDTHCHLDDRRFADDRDAVVQAALDAGVTCMISIGTGDGPPDLEAGIRMAERYPRVFASVGVPAKATADTTAALRHLATHPKVLHLGEMGLDYHYDHSPRDIQRAVFRRQLELAAELRIPVSIHTREAWEDTIQCIREVWQGAAPGGIFHCFSGTPAQAAEALSLGFHLGFGGVLTFPKAEELRAAASITPLHRIVVETDAPYLAPLPHRGKRNEPAYVVRTAERLAGLLGIEFSALQQTIWKNVQELFFARLTANQ
ncbi:MAG: TatD family hydrolase [Bryobacterales bacterium]|nr:TatD family hydrolase [Bryobacterales bacterium]